jgi:hypothetical protein
MFAAIVVPLKRGKASSTTTNADRHAVGVHHFGELA